MVATLTGNGFAGGGKRDIVPAICHARALIPWHYLWIAPHALQFIIAIVMVRRGLWREFPLFFSYTLFTVVEQGTLFILDHRAAVTPEQYWCDRWVFLSIEVPLRFAIVFEIFSNVFRDYPGLSGLRALYFVWRP